MAKMSPTHYTNLTQGGTNLCNESVDEDRFGLSVAVDPEQCLKVVRRIPAGIKDDYTICRHQVYTEASSSGGDQEETDSVQTVKTRGEMHTGRKKWPRYY